MSWKSTKDVKRDEAIGIILRMLAAAGNEAIASVLETLNDDAYDREDESYLGGYNFQIKWD